MENVAVVTDSCASLPEDMLARLGIRTVAYYIHRGQEVLRDLVNHLTVMITPALVCTARNRSLGSSKNITLTMRT